jgi:hypothetical protein
MTHQDLKNPLDSPLSEAFINITCLLEILSLPLHAHEVGNENKDTTNTVGDELLNTQI